VIGVDEGDEGYRCAANLSGQAGQRIERGVLAGGFGIVFGQHGEPDLLVEKSTQAGSQFWTGAGRQ
jgi:hypothetical protein